MRTPDEVAAALAAAQTGPNQPGVRVADAMGLVDNASRDGSVEYAKQEFPQIRTIVNEGNLGFSSGNNRGDARPTVVARCENGIAASRRHGPAQRRQEQPVQRIDRPLRRRDRSISYCVAATGRHSGLRWRSA